MAVATGLIGPEVAPGGDPGKIDRSASGIPIVPALDGFRAFAILGVVLFHLLGNSSLVTADASRHMIYGVLPSLVEMLFVISGFVVFLPTVARGGHLGSVGSFAIRRVARLMPAYWLSLVVVVAMLILWPTGGADLPGIGSVAVHGAMAQVPATLVDRGFLIGFGIDAPVWTLSLEIAFYLVLPFIASACFRHPFRALLIAGSIEIGWKLATVHLDGLASFVGLHPTPGGLELTRLVMDNQLPAFALPFGAGMAAAWLFVSLPQRYPAEAIRRRAGRVQIASLIALAICAYFFGRYAVSSNTLFPAHLARRSLVLSVTFPLALAAFALSTALASQWRQVPFALPSIRALGDISYGIYLIHFPMILFVIALLPSLVGAIGAFWTATLVALPAAVLYGWASAHYVEQPIRRWAQRFGRRSAAGSAAVGAGSAP